MSGPPSQQGVLGALYLAVRVGGGPEADEVGPGLGEGQAGLGAAGQGVQHPALVDILELTQVLTQPQLRGVALEQAGGDIVFSMFFLFFLFYIPGTSFQIFIEIYI